MRLQVDSIVKELAHSPLLPFIQRQIEELMTDEKRRREAFHCAIDSGDPRYYRHKVEFINGEAGFLSCFHQATCIAFISARRGSRLKRTAGNPPGASKFEVLVKQYKKHLTIPQ